MIYRILTEDKNRGLVLENATRMLDSFTWYTANGVWRGNWEPSLIIEHESNKAGIEAEVVKLARVIKFSNEQEAVLLQKIPTAGSRLI